MSLPNIRREDGSVNSEYLRSTFNIHAEQFGFKTANRPGIYILMNTNGIEIPKWIYVGSSREISDRIARNCRDLVGIRDEHQKLGHYNHIRLYQELFGLNFQHLKVSAYLFPDWMTKSFEQIERIQPGSFEEVLRKTENHIIKMLRRQYGNSVVNLKNATTNVQEKKNREDVKNAINILELFDDVG
jgi:hypothetical protein